jgi:hypothetical protein
MRRAHPGAETDALLSAASEGDLNSPIALDTNVLSSTRPHVLPHGSVVFERFGSYDAPLEIFKANQR